MEPPFPPLTAEADQRAEVVFFEALKKSPDERVDFLNSECGTDTRLRAEVDGLLRDHEKAGSFLSADGPVPAELEAELVRGQTEEAGAMIGPYKLLQQIGEGGFGVVWMAEQERPVRRRVALKIIKLGMDTKDVVGRFEQERQALAMMDHPNIATVLDAGATPLGRPFFVMELVRGIRITEYCDQVNLPTAERLRLFIAVCHAVQHAHQKGIIHRDVKPSNILVTLHDGIPVPKVIDFGVAKATQQRLTDRTVFTKFEQMIGTPAYMSPEQAEMSGLDIDTRSDIYSLGVLLYELLTSQTPFDGRELLASGLEAMRRVIREQEPLRPSTCLSTMLAADLTTVAKHRQSESVKLTHSIRGDLDWIVMKAMEKDRTRRYETASGLAQDIQRHLQYEPVQARPPTTLYRFRRMVRRNKLAFAAGSAVLAALLTGLSVSMWMFFKEMAARERALVAEQEQERLGQVAETEKKAAKTEAAISSQTADFLRDMLGSIGPLDTLGDRGDRLRTFLDKTAERIGKDLKDQPKVEGEFRSILGNVYFRLGEHSKAEALVRESLALFRKVHGNEHSNVAIALTNLACALSSQKKMAEAESVQREALAMAKKLLGSDDPTVADALRGLSDILEAQGKSADAEATFREALAMYRKLNGDEHPGVASSLYRLGTRLADGKPAEAEAMLREALTIQRKRLGNEHPDVWSSLNNLTYVLDAQSKWAESEPVYREVLENGRKLWGNEHGRVAVLLYNFGENLRNQGKLAEAEIVHREALAMNRKLHGDEHGNVATSLNNLGLVLQGQGKLAEAEAVHREALAMRRKLLGSEHSEVAQSLDNLAGILRGQRKFAEAESAYREALEMSRKLLGDEHASVAHSLYGLGLLLRRQGRLPEAEAMLREALALWKKLPDSEHPEVARSLHELAHVLEEEGNPAEAEKIFREALAVQGRSAGEADPEVANIRGCLIKLLKSAGRLAEVEAEYREKLAVQRKSLGNEHPDVAVLLTNLALALEPQAKLAEAETIYREVLAMRRKLVGNEHPDVAGSVVQLSSVLRKQGRHDEARELLTTELAAIRKSASQDPAVLDRVVQQIADILYREGRYAEGERLYRELLETRRARLGAEHEQVLSATASLARLLTDWAWAERGAEAKGPESIRRKTERALEAERLLREVLAIRTEVNHWRTDETRSRLGGALLAVAVTAPSLDDEARAAKLADAESLLLKANDVLEAGGKVDSKYKRDSLTRIVRLYEALEQPEKAVEWQQKLDDFDKAEADMKTGEKNDSPGH